MWIEARRAGWRRTAGRPGAAGSPAADSRGSTPERRRGWSSMVSAVCMMPAMECLLGRLRDLATPAPSVEAIVDDKARQVRERGVGRRDGGSIGGGTRQQLAGRLHCGLFGEGKFVAFHELLAPGVDLLVDVDLDGAYIAAAAIERRRERQVAVFMRIEGRVD